LSRQRLIDVELADRTIEPRGLLRERAACGGRLLSDARQPFLCRARNLANAPLISNTRRAIRHNASPAAATSLPPFSSCEIEAEIRPLISLAACAERCVSARQTA
jgi:hypothetical protein